ncbi:MAG: electron transfer flavoprotein subunit beta/FixA family protein [Synergistaceae bacterium]|nr:electron transfer flavoprotein subunit beta/FixA family protein [Synergistaceae bacterium]
MKIMVCVKQVPDTEMIKVDPVTGSLIREGVPSIINPFDLNALEAALQLRGEYGGNVAAVCMGPPQAEEALRDCLAMGADSAVLISDRVFKDSDTLATSYVLSLAARQFGPFDLILCGKHSLDGETGQVGPQIAEFLGWNQVTYVSKMTRTEEGFVIDREMEGGIEKVMTRTPIVCTVTKTHYEPRKATMKGKLMAKKAHVETVDSKTLNGLDTGRIGLVGSPTSVAKSFVPPDGEPGTVIEEPTAVESAAKLIKLLTKAEAI